MSTLADMIDDVRDRINDPTDTEIPLATKIRFLNRGQAAMYPKIYRVVSDTMAMVGDQYEYELPMDVASGALLGVEQETGVGTGRFAKLTRYDILPGNPPVFIVLDTLVEGADLRFTSAERLAPMTAASYVQAQAVTYSGPAGTEELPVLYAMGLITSRRLDDRMDYARYAATQQPTVDPNDIMQTAQFWFAQFELLLDRLQMVPPTPRV